MCPTLQHFDTGLLKSELFGQHLGLSCHMHTIQLDASPRDGAPSRMDSDFLYMLTLTFNTVVLVFFLASADPQAL